MATTSPKESKAASKTPQKSAADKDVPEAGPEEDTPPPKKRKFLKILLVLLPLLAIAAGAAWYFLHDREPEANGKAAGTKGPASKTASTKPPVFVPLEPFTVNLQHDDTAPQYLQVGLTLKVTDSAVVDAVKLRMPEIRNRVLLLLTSKKGSEITSSAGKTALSTEIVRETNAALAGTSASPGVDSALFTSFVIQ